MFIIIILLQLANAMVIPVDVDSTWSCIVYQDELREVFVSNVDTTRQEDFVTIVKKVILETLHIPLVIGRRVKVSIKKITSK
jgi:hypothetical protein